MDAALERRAQSRVTRDLHRIVKDRDRGKRRHDIRNSLQSVSLNRVRQRAHSGGQRFVEALVESQNDRCITKWVKRHHAYKVIHIGGTSRVWPLSHLQTTQHLNLPTHGWIGVNGHKQSTWPIVAQKPGQSRIIAMLLEDHCGNHHGEDRTGLAFPPCHTNLCALTHR